MICGGDSAESKVEYERANDDVVHDNVDRQTVNNGSSYTSVVRELSAILTAAISGIIETIGVRASSDDDLMCGVSRLIGP